MRMWTLMSTLLNVMLNVAVDVVEENAVTICCAVRYATPESDPVRMSCPEIPEFP